MAGWRVLSNSEALKALFRLKQATRTYRQKANAANALQMKDCFSEAAVVAAKDAETWTEIMREATNGALKWAIEAVDTEKLKALIPDSPVCDLFDSEEVDKFRKYLKECASLDARIAKVKQSFGGKLQSGSGIKVKEEDVKVGELRREITAAIKRDKKLSEAEKEERLQALAAAREIKVQAKGAKCKFFFGDFTVDTVLARDGVQLEGKFSKYAGLSAETVKTLKNGKYVTTAGLQVKSAKAADARAAKKQEAEEKVYKKLLDDRTEKEAKMPQMVKNLFGSVLPEKVFDDVGGNNLLASVCQEPQKAEAAFCLCLANGVMNSYSVWSLFREKDKKDCFDKSSYYEKCLQSTVREHNISPAEQAELLYAAYSDKSNQDLKTLITKRVIALAGMVLPYEEAKKMLQQEVYKSGMAIRCNDRFDWDKFVFMNQVLGEDGYKIQLCELPVNHKATKEAKPLSEEILADMHRADGIKAFKNKEIALMYRLGELRRNKPGVDLDNPGSSPQTQNLYNTFMQVFYNAEPHRSGGLYDKTYELQWRAFVDDEGNMQKADAVYAYFDSEAGRAGTNKADTLTRWLGNLEEGKYIDPDNPLISSSAHHVFYRRFAGVLNNPVAEVNAVDNVTPVISMHPADIDLHKDEEHRFDMKEVYLFKRDNVVMTGTFNKVRKEDVLLVPMVMKRQKDGSFRLLMEPDTLLATAEMTVKEPKVMGRSSGVPEKSLWKDLSQARGDFLNKRPPNDGEER